MSKKSEELIKKIEVFIKVPNKIKFSICKLKIALAELHKNPKETPKIFKVSWHKFFQEIDNVDLTKNILGEQFDSLYLLHMGKEYREFK